MNKEQYRELLKDERWKKFRQKIIERDNYRCVKCGKSTGALHVHHKLYIHGKMPWEYKQGHLETLCNGCHKNVHDNFNIPVFSSLDAKGAVSIEQGNRSAKKKKRHRQYKNKKLKKWEVKEEKLKEQVNSKSHHQESLVKKICDLYFSLGKRREQRDKNMYEIRKYQRAYITQYGNNFDPFPIEVMNNLFLNWDG